jgi:tRNA-guanine family transglycosylase
MTPDGRLALRRAVYRDDVRPLVAGCPCPACTRFSRAYLRHLFMAGEILGHRLLTLHNVTHLANLMAAAREAITAGRFGAFRAESDARLRAGRGADDGADEAPLPAPARRVGTPRIPATLDPSG